MLQFGITCGVRDPVGMYGECTCIMEVPVFWEFNLVGSIGACIIGKNPFGCSVRKP